MVAAHPTLLMLLSLKKVFLKGFFKELVFLKIQDFEFCFVHFELFFFYSFLMCMFFWLEG